MSNRLRNTRRSRWSFEDKAFGAVIAIWVAAIVANLVFWGVVIWAIINVVQHFVGA